MRRGDFARAWEISDAHLHALRAGGGPVQMGPRHLQRIWDGEPLAGKRVLVRCYHGLGDTVQFVRFIAPLRAFAREVTLWAQPRLVRLLEAAAGADRVLPLHDGVPDVAFDCDIEIMELAHALRAQPATIARRVPYLFPKSSRERLPISPHELAVGLVWRAGDWNPERSLPAQWLATLNRVRGVRFFSLQTGPAAAEAALIGAQDIGSEDAELTAARLRCLDLAIVVDTFAAHLAGALGVPTWLLLHHDCDWRWMKDRRDCVWYPTMRLYRQPAPGDWTSVINEVKAGLEELSG